MQNGFAYMNGILDSCAHDTQMQTFQAVNPEAAEFLNLKLKSSIESFLLCIIVQSKSNTCQIKEDSKW